MSGADRRWRLSFRAKTVLGIALIELLLLALLIWSSLDFLSRARLEALATRAEGTASQFASLAQDAVLSEDLAALGTFADSVMADRQLAYLRVIGYDRVLVARGDATALARPFRADEPGQSPTDGLFDAAADVTVGGTPFGRIEVGLDTTSKDGLAAAARERLIVIAGIEILLVALFSLLLGGYLTRALERLRDAAATISDGGPGVTVPVRGNDEVAVTTQAFNRMSEQLLASYDALRDARRAAEQAAAEAEAASLAAQRANATKSRFLAHMSHELRTPLNAVLGILQLSRDWELTSPQHEQLGIAEQSGRALLELINEVLDLSKIEAGEMALHEEPVDLSALVRSVADIIRPMARSKDLALVPDLDAGLPASMRADPLRLRQVLVNLAGNAVKFTERGQVRIAVQTLCPGQDCQRLRFEVTDTGIGIPPEHQPALFDEFAQVGQTRAQRQGGTGLGLSISQRIVNLMGGQIRVDSTPGQGSRFWFEIVLHTAAAPMTVAPPITPSCRVPGPGTGPGQDEDAAAPPVLVVDDVPTNVLVAKAMLKKAGYRVETASNGQEALDAVCAQPLALILMDLEMPVLDGLAATRQIRDRGEPNRAVPIIAMTAHALGEEQARCMAAGMDDFVTKPFAREGFLATVARWHGARHRPGDASAADTGGEWETAAGSTPGGAPAQAGTPARNGAAFRAD